MAGKKAFKVIGIVVGAIVALLVVACVVLVVMFPPGKVKAMVLPHVEKAVGRKVEVRGAGLSFFPVFGLRITGLEIANTQREGFSNEAFVSLDQFVVQVDVAPLLRKKVVIRQVLLRKPTILIELDHAGSFNYSDLAFMQADSAAVKTEEKPKEEPKAGSAGAPALPIPLSLRKFAVEKGRVVYHDMKAGRKVTIGSIDHRIDFSVDRELRDVKSTGELVLSSISVIAGEIPTALNNFRITFCHDIEADVKEGFATINSMRASLQKIYVNMSGTVRNFNDTPELDLKIRTDKIMIADLIAEVPVELAPVVGKLRAKGFIELAMDLAGTVDESGVPSLAGHLSLGDGEIHYADLPESINGLSANVKFGVNSLDLSELKFNLGKNPVVVMAKIENFARPTVDAAIHATIDLGSLKGVVEFPEGVTLAGIIKADVKAKGEVDPNDPSKIDVAGKVAMKNIRATTPELTKPVLVNGTVDFTPQKIAHQMKVGIGASNLSIHSSLADYLGLVLVDSTKPAPRPKLSFDVRSSLLNTDEFLAKKEQAAAPASAAVGAPAQTPSSGTPAPILAAPLPAVDVLGNISCARLIYEGIELTNLKADIRSVGDIVDVSMRAGLYQGTLSNKLGLDARNLNNVGVSLRFGVDKVQVNDFVSHFNDLLSEDQALYKDIKKLDNGIFGVLTLNADFRGRGATTDDLTKSLNGTVKADVSNGRIKAGVITKSIAGVLDKFLKLGDIEFRSLKMQADVKDEQVTLETFDMISPKTGDWTVGGKVGFNAALDLEVGNRLPGSISSKITGLQSKGKAQLKGAATKLLGSGLGRAAGSMIDAGGIPADKDGRVTVVVPLRGTASSPKAGMPRFARPADGGGQASELSAGESVVREVKKMSREAAESAKKAVKQELDKKKKEATQAVKKEVAKVVGEKAAEKIVSPEAKTETGEIKKKAVKKLKKLF